MAPFARVAVCRPVDRTLHYTIPAHLVAAATPGVRCLVPLGPTREVGFLVALDSEAEVARLKPLAEILDPEPCLPPDLLELGSWLSRYYHWPPGETLATLLPAAYRARAEPVYRAVAGAPPESPAARRLWERAAQGDGLATSGLPPRGVAALARLAADGFLTRQWRALPVPPLRGEEWLALAPAAPDPAALGGRSPRLVQLLQELAEGPLPARAVVARGVPRASLRRAQARGWVVVHSKPPRGADLAGHGVGAPGGGLLLTLEQRQAVEAVAGGLAAGEFRPLLLQGVTGSGKTEVYLRAAQAARERGLGALVLVPEIGLTPQMLGRFAARFGDEVAILHSGLGARERRLQWERVRRGEAPVVVGARSAVFAPLPRLGVVVVDEEHDHSYKQEEGLRYHAKHVALMRARLAGCVALLGSATPDVETLWAARTGRYGHLLLPRRVRGAALPRIQVVDLRQEDARRRSRVLLSEPLRRAVTAALGRGEQALLFLNRRGFSPAVVCADCGAAVSCSHCAISLTLHRARGDGRLLCHYCGVQRPVPEFCPGCGSGLLGAAGAGTQRLVEEAGREWPEARVVRLDRDAVRRAGGAEVLRSFHEGHADVLVGTQMVAKGHHFPKLTVVGVVDADQSLHFPDFRCSERTFQVLTQVAGRAGREELAGQVVVQTRNPDHPVIRAAVQGDYAAFAERELASRREAGFPPFRRLVLLRVSAPEEAAGRRAAAAVADLFREWGGRSGVEVLGPAAAPLERIRGRWRFQVLLRGPGPEPGPLQGAVRAAWRRLGELASGEVRVAVDLDPVALL